MNTEVMFSSKAMDWATPQAFFDQLDSEFHFTLDPCADQSNHKCVNYFTVEDNGLKQPWGGADGLLQSAVWQGYQRLGEEMLRRGEAAQHNRSAADSSTNGHHVFSRLHLPKAQRGDPIYPRPSEIWRRKELSTIPQHGSHLPLNYHGKSHMSITHSLVFNGQNTREIAKISDLHDDSTPKSDQEIMSEAQKLIHAFCDERNFKIYYVRVWNADGETIFDVGSHTEFFNLVQEVNFSGEGNN